MAIVVFEAEENDRQYLAARFLGEDIRFVPEPLTTPEQAKRVAADADVISVFVHSRITPDVFAEMPALKMVATRSTGFDHVDPAAALERGIIVSNVPTYGENTVAEHTFALILALSRNLHKAYVRTSAGDMSMHGLTGFDLQGKTIGVVGTGHIGLHVIRIAHGFGMNVIAYDPYPNSTLAELLNYKYVSLDDLLAQSDIVTLHAPLTPQNKHLIGAHNIGTMKQGALLINTARGGLVDTVALISALDSGLLRGAGLDVIEGEEIFSEEKQLLGAGNMTEEHLRMALRNITLLRRPDMVITPHIAFDSTEAIERILATTVENIRAFRAGTPRNMV
ncbi:MAG TPA: hydroxyacid dehydrogenase [Capsulimonadaceae bacterium]|jgi:D-lactate dehydrogenase